MKNYAIVRIYKKRKNTYKYKEILVADKFKFNKKPFGRSYWELKIEEPFEAKVNFIKEKYKKNGLKVEIIEKKYLRNSNYRKSYFDSHMGIFNKYYICSYCGKILTKDTATIDHIIPINKAMKSKFVRIFTKILKIEDINDEKNLTVACKRCNSRKGNKTGIWVLGGFVGQYIIIPLKLSILILILRLIIYKLI